MSNQQLEQSFHHVVRSERKIMHEVVLHILEISRRKFYLEKNYESLYDYLTKEMLYSSSSAQRRIEGARLLEEVPSVASKLESGEINLSQICELQKSVKEAEKIHRIEIPTETKAEILDQLSGLNKSESQQLIAESLEIPVSQNESIKTQKDHSRKAEIVFNEEQWAKFVRLKGLVAHKHFQKKRTQKVADVLETLFDELLSQYGLEPTGDTSFTAPAQTQSSSKVKAVCADISGSEMTSSKTATAMKTAKVETIPSWKSLTPKRKKLILQEDECCQYTDYETGRICGSTFNLQVDHIIPRHAGGSNNPGNLRVLCRAHNLYREKVRPGFDLSSLR